MTALADVTAETRAKYLHLIDILSKMKQVLVAYSGGVDSTLLLKTAVDTLGDRVLAVTALSATTPKHEKRDAAEYALSMNVRHLEIHSDEMTITAFTANPPDKCYLCKKNRFGALVKMAAELKIPYVVDGENRDDDDDYRPGSRAARELGVRSPLREAGLFKAEIRELSRSIGLASWNKPAYACLASRIPYGQPITVEKLEQVDMGESFLRELNLSSQVRLRHEGETARIEVEPEAIERFLDTDVRHRIATHLKTIGFKFVALDLDGYRTGSLNRVLEPQAELDQQVNEKGVVNG